MVQQYLFDRPRLSVAEAIRRGEIPEEYIRNWENAYLLPDNGKKSTAETTTDVTVSMFRKERMLGSATAGRILSDKNEEDFMPNRFKEPHTKDPRKLASGRWQARVTYYDPKTGQRRETTQTFLTEREAKK